MKPGKILLVDDEQIARENLAFILEKEGYDTLAVESGVRALEELAKNEFDLVITDLRMPQMDGMQVVERTKELYPETEVVVITGYATVATAVEAMQKGAYHYLAKPYQNNEVRILIRKALEKRELQLLVHELQREVETQKGFPELIGKNPKMAALKATIAQIAPTDCNILILGETGTGKELLARAIHHFSRRSHKRFLAVNCGAFSEELLANELFGHEKEAFT
jgi:DNA-binding NtrC family response regulator